MKLIKFYLLITLCWLTLEGVQAQNASLCVPATISVREGNTTITCEPGAPTTVRFRTSRVNTPYGFAVTDQEGYILRVSISDRVSFVGLPGGQLRVYAFSYLGLVLAEEGLNVFDDDLASVCSALSSNYIEILNIVPEGGQVQSANGRSTEYICTDDELPDILTFETSEVNEPIYAYLITDEANKLLDISADGTADFSQAPSGVCRVWGIAYTGNLTVSVGDPIDGTELAEGCYDLSDNFVSVIRTQPDGATITVNGEVGDVEVCDYPEATNITVTLATTNTQTFFYAYLITDEAETTFTVVEGNSINLSELPVGRSRVRGISYAGALAATAGSYPDFADAGTGCFDLSDNFITLTRTFVAGGEIALAGGGTEIRPCGIDQLPDEFSFQTNTTSPEAYAWILTDATDEILAVFTENLVRIDDFTSTDDFRVRGLSYSGAIQEVAGQALAEASLSDGCFEVSENFVTITRIRPEGGSVALADDSVSFTGCDSPDTAGQTILELSNTGDPEFSYTFLLTDTDNNLLQIIEGEAIPLSSLPAGVSRIWGLSYEGDLTAQPGENPTSVDPVAGCFDLSDNFIEVERIVVDGGDLSLLNGGNEAITCGNDNVPDAFTFSSTTIATDQPYVLVVTNENNRVFSTVNGAVIDFDLFAPGTYRIWGLSYTGTLNIAFGNILTDITPSDGCFDLSNTFVTIRQEEVNGGQLQFAGGGVERFTCPGDGNPDVLNFLNNGFSSDGYVYLITDPENVILATTTGPGFDFEGAPAGICRIWGLAYSGALNAPVGEKADTLLFSDECYSLSSNFLRVVREVPTAGVIALDQGGDTVFTCPTDGLPDVLNFSNTSTYPGAYVYLITDDQDQVMDVSLAGQYDFEFAAPGTCRVYGVAYTGEWLIEEGASILTSALSDDCWEITENFITVVREVPDGGTLAFGDDTAVQYTCPGDGQADVLTFASSTAYPGAFLYLITDENNLIIDSTTDGSFDFDPAPVGTCRIWGLAYTGELQFQVGDDAGAIDLSDDCFDLSDNFLTVVRDTPDAGVISTPAGDSLTLCTGDIFADLVQLNVDGASNSQYAYLITDPDGFLVSPIIDPEFDFNNAQGGLLRIYGIAYTGQINAFPGDNIFDTPMSTDCYSITESYITLNLLRVDGSTIFTDSGVTDIQYVCDGDGVADPIVFNNGNNDPNVNYRYFITDTDNRIIGRVNGNSLDAEGSPLDTLRIWGAAFIGTAALPVGEDITAAMLSDSCFDLSDNYLTIVNDLPEGGTVTTANGKENLRVCIGGASGLVDFVTTSGSQSGYLYLITSPDLAIIGSSESSTIDFNELEVGNYLVHGLSYTGELTFAVGDTVGQVELASSCYELSTNSVQVERTPPLDGGTITSAFGDPLYICLDDGAPDIGAFETSSTDPNYRYVITDTLNRILVPDIEGNVINFDQADPGFFRVYGVSFTGNFMATFGTNILTGVISDRCSAVSSNFITLVSDNFDGGSVATEDGLVNVSVTVGDGIADLIRFDSTGASGTNYAYVITDQSNNILEIVDGDSKDFEAAGEGTCRVWGLSYSGEILAAIGDPADQTVLTDGCYTLSENFITVEKVEPGAPYTVQVPFQVANARLKMQLYPNPVSKILNIRLLALFDEIDLEGQTTVEVFDLSGRRLINEVQVITERESNFELDVNELPIGMYMLRVTNGAEHVSQRFFKQ